MGNEASKTAVMSEVDPEELNKLFAEYIQSGKRERISLALHKFASARRIQLDSDHVHIAGFQWYLSVKRHNADCLFALVVTAPFRCTFKFELDYSLHLSNTFPAQDIHEEGQQVEMVPVNADPELNLLNNIFSSTFGYNMFDSVKIEDLVDPSKGFLRPDGSIQVEFDFTITKATVDDFPMAANKGKFKPCGAAAMRKKLQTGKEEVEVEHF